MLRKYAPLVCLLYENSYSLFSHLAAEEIYCVSGSRLKRSRTWVEVWRLYWRKHTTLSTFLVILSWKKSSLHAIRISISVTYITFYNGHVWKIKKCNFTNRTLCQWLFSKASFFLPGIPVNIYSSYTSLIYVVNLLYNLKRKIKTKFSRVTYKNSKYFLFNFTVARGHTLIRRYYYFLNTHCALKINSATEVIFSSQWQRIRQPLRSK